MNSPFVGELKNAMIFVLDLAVKDDAEFGIKFWNILYASGVIANGAMTCGYSNVYSIDMAKYFKQYVKHGYSYSGGLGFIVDPSEISDKARWFTYDSTLGTYVTFDNSDVLNNLYRGCIFVNPIALDFILELTSDIWEDPMREIEFNEMYTKEDVRNEYMHVLAHECIYKFIDIFCNLVVARG